MKRITFLIFTLLIFPPNSEASVVTVDFAGNITNQYSSQIIPTGYSFGDPFTGRFAYDTSLMGVPVQSDTTYYEGLSLFELTISGRTFTSPIAVAEITNNTNSGTEDVLTISSGTRLNPAYSIIGPTFDGFTGFNMQLQMRDRTATVFSSTSLPESSLNISEFGSNNNAITLLFTGAGADPRLYPLWGKITAISVTVVHSIPEPTTLLLLALGIPMLAAAQIRKHRVDA